MLDTVPFVTDSIPYLTVDQMREVDRLMVEEYRIGLPQMMEHAGRHLAHLGRERFFGGDARDRAVVVLAGTGGNGGGALVAARRLHSWGATVRVFVTGLPDRFAEIPRRQLEVLPQVAVAVAPAEAIDTVSLTELVIDGLIGYGLQEAPSGAAADLIRWANGQPAPVLALDVPSGLDASSGEVSDPTIRADATMTLALPKEGLRTPGAGEVVGELYLADIGVPRSLYALPTVGLEVGPVFSKGDVVRLR
jgi:NAD(P)H-hydrate epimerase